MGNPSRRFGTPLSICALLILAISVFGCGGSPSPTTGNSAATAGDAGSSASSTLALPIPPTYMGLHHHFGGEFVPWATPWPPSEPFGAMRLWESGVDWGLVETARGVYDWKTLDNWINLAQAGGYKVEYTFGRTPAWAAAATNVPPSDMKFWDEFVTAVATRYKGKIEAYEVWNEANAAPFYSGSVADLVTMQQHAYKIIKSIDSSALVLSPSCQGASWGYLDKFLTGGATGSMDAVAVHLYNQSPEVDGAAMVVGYRNVMKAHGMANMPMWNTEFGWGLNTSMPDPDDQAAFLARSYLLLWGMGVPRNYWYAYDDSDWGTLRLPGTGNPGTIAPAGEAYQTVYSWVVGRTPTPCSHTGSVWSCQFTDATGATSLAVWNTAGSSKYSTGIYNRYQDLTGAIYSISNGAISIGKKPILLFTTTTGSH